jgi:ATP-dependent helicase Lhr and Lhr-like helicase
LASRIAQLEGLGIPAICWERDILPSRMLSYQSSDLDQLCSSGKIVWLRLLLPAKTIAAQSKSATYKLTPFSLISREHLPHWRAYAPLPEVGDLELSGIAQQLYTALKNQGASFFQELQSETGLLKSYLEQALSELAASGLLTADSFQALRTLLIPEKILHRHSKRYPGYDPFQNAGRWSLLRFSAQQAGAETNTHCEYVAKVLLRRYGVIFRKLLERETILPSWRELLYVYRRMEARGELRGGRFVQGYSGEQFALPEALNKLRQIRKAGLRGELTAISAADPLNLTGIITPGARIPVQAGHKILYCDGKPIATNVKGKISFLDLVSIEEQTRYSSALLLPSARRA